MLHVWRQIRVPLEAEPPGVYQRPVVRVPARAPGVAEDAPEEGAALPPGLPPPAQGRAGVRAG